VLVHVAAATQSIHRRLSTKVALGDATATDIADREAVEAFRAGLPAIRTRTLIGLLILATIVFGRLALEHASGALSAVPAIQSAAGQRA
jgi:hypothetical protein